MIFPLAIAQLIQQRVPSIRRGTWPEGIELRAQFPDDHSKMTAPYLYLESDEGSRLPYVLQPEDVFAENWELNIVEMADKPRE